MSKSFNRRRNRQLKALRDLREMDKELFLRKTNEILEQWRREIRFRAGRLLYKSGKPVPEVWEFFKRKIDIAKELGLEETLSELCRQAVARQIGKIGKAKAQLGSTRHLLLQRD